MKIKLINVSTKNHPESLTLEECGFKVGDVVDVDGSFNDGDLCVLAIRNTPFISVGENVSVDTSEYEIVKG